MKGAKKKPRKLRGFFFFSKQGGQHQLDKKDQDQRRRYGAHHAPEVQPSGLRF